MSAALVGVMIAVALIPPAATTGLGLAYLEPNIAVSSFLLVILNLLCINLAALITLWFKGYRPERTFEERISRFLTLKRGSILLIGITIISGFLTVTSLEQRSTHRLETSVRQYLTKRDIPIHNFEMEYDLNFLYRTPREIRVHTRELDRDLANNLHDYLQKRLGRDLSITVIEQQRSESNR